MEPRQPKQSRIEKHSKYREQISKKWTFVDWVLNDQFGEKTNSVSNTIPNEEKEIYQRTFALFPSIKPKLNEEYKSQQNFLFPTQRLKKYDSTIDPNVDILIQAIADFEAEVKKDNQDLNDINFSSGKLQTLIDNLDENE